MPYTIPASAFRRTNGSQASPPTSSCDVPAALYSTVALADTVVHVPHLSAVYLWSRVASCLGIAKFYEPIAVPGKRQRLTTIRDAALYITSLPEPERGAEHWRPAATLLRLIGENGGCVVFPGLALMYGLRKGVQPEPPEPDPSKKTTHWGKRESKRQHLIAPGFRMRV
jgi:hypothetical protein